MVLPISGALKNRGNLRFKLETAQSQSWNINHYALKCGRLLLAATNTQNGFVNGANTNAQCNNSVRMYAFRICSCPSTGTVRLIDTCGLKPVSSSAQRKDRGITGFTFRGIVSKPRARRAGREKGA
jgi:hypothetical protein